MSERKIGKVISVDSFRVYIKLDDDLKSLYKSGYEDIYEVARINSYIIIPIGADRIVAIVTRVKSMDETEVASDREAIFLTQSARYLIATMIGTIENTGNYIQGVYNYPVLDNHVWYITKIDLDRIFDQDIKPTIDYSKDYFLPIGTSPSFTDYKIKVNPDKFFGKHAAILGNTGSGKSCTVASIIQSLFNYDYNGASLRSAHFLIFDTNGEYKNAFMGSKNEKGENTEYLKRSSVNPFYIDQAGMKVPFWFMNFDNFDYLFEPSANTQVPVLKRALSIARDTKSATDEKLIPRPFLSFLTDTLLECQHPDYKIRSRIFRDLKLYCEEFAKLVTSYDTKSFKAVLKKLYAEKKNFKEDSKGYVTGTLNPTVFSEVSAALALELSVYNIYASGKIINEERNIDLPIWFDFDNLINQFIDHAIDELETSNNRIREFIATLKLRMQSYLNDERIANPLMLNHKEDIEDSLAKFLAFVMGDFCKVYQTKDKDTFTEYYKKQLQKSDFDKLGNGSSQITIIDMSLLPFEVLETVTGLIGRLIMDFAARIESNKRGAFPMVIVLEEAQNYIPERNAKDKISISKKVFERISREGRKFGVSLLVSSQRPSELSKTVLSQCNSFIIHRLQNPEDQKYVRQLVSAANEDILNQLPILPQQHAVVMGDAVRTPVQVKINNASPKPNSENPEFIKNWLKEQDEKFPGYKAIADKWVKGKQ
jgi:uncharacterized protein